MINPIASSSVPIPQSVQAQNAPPAVKPPANPPGDQVQLSPRATSAGDVDHDGDSH